MVTRSTVRAFQAQRSGLANRRCRDVAPINVSAVGVREVPQSSAKHQLPGHASPVRANRSGRLHPHHPALVEVLMIACRVRCTYPCALHTDTSNACSAVLSLCPLDDAVVLLCVQWLFLLPVHDPDARPLDPLASDARQRAAGHWTRAAQSGRLTLIPR